MMLPTAALSPISYKINWRPNREEVAAGYRWAYLQRFLAVSLQSSLDETRPGVRRRYVG